MTTRIAFVLTLVAAILLLTGCEGGPKCLDYDTQVVSTTTIVNGKVVPGTSVVTICTRYEDEGERK
jgi:uncharacterized lipoprotein YajG